MYGNAVGFNPGKTVLGGLSKKTGDAGAFGKSQAMAASAGLNLDAAKQNQELGMQQMQDDSRLRQQDSQNKSQRAENESQGRVMKGALDSRKNVFDADMGYQYAGLRKRKQLSIQQALLNHMMGDG